MQKIFLTGLLGDDASVKTTPDGKQYLAFSLAVSEGKKPDQTTTWWACTAWAPHFVTSSLKDFMKKGTKIFVDGKPQPRPYVNKDNQACVSNDVFVHAIELLSSPQQPGTPQQVVGTAQMTVAPAYKAQSANMSTTTQQTPEFDTRDEVVF